MSTPRVYPVSIPEARSKIANSRHIRDEDARAARVAEGRADLFTANLDRAVRVEVQKRRGAPLDDVQVSHLVGLLLDALGCVPGDDVRRIEAEVRRIAAANGARPAFVRRVGSEA